MISNYTDFKKEIEKYNQETIKKKLLLHSCCAPCSSHVLTVIAKAFDLTILFDNPNIYPKEEFDYRLEELNELVKKMNLNINVEYLPYDHDKYLIAIKGKEKLGEKSPRCYSCYELRLKDTYEYAKANGYDLYTTTLSISPYKNSDWINEIGNRYSDEKCQFIYSNYKKEQGYLHSIELSKQYDLYRQDYCGCEFSQEERKRKTNE